MKTQIYPSYGIAASVAAKALQDDPRATIKIDPVAIGFVVTIRRPKPMKAGPIWIRVPRREPCTQVHEEIRHAS